MTGSKFSNVLICDTRGDALAAYVAARQPDLVCRVRTANTITTADRVWADVLIGFGVPVDLGRSSIRWVHSTGAGVDSFLTRSTWPTGVTLTRTTGELGLRIAEYCVGHALAMSQRILAFRDEQIARRWTPIEPTLLRGTTAVIVGTGSVGSAIATRFTALGCVAVGVSRSGDARWPFERVYPTEALAGVVTTARWLVLAVPLTQETEGLITAPVLARCRDAFLINVARGRVLDTTALLEALDTGSLIGAALDVFDDEPLPAESPLWRAHGVLITPHIAGITHVEEAGEAFLDALAQIEAGETPANHVDPTSGY